MIKLTVPQSEVLACMGYLSGAGTPWLTSGAIADIRMKGKDGGSHKSYKVATERVLDNLHNRVPALVQRHLQDTAFCWRLTVAGKAVIETRDIGWNV